LNSGFSNKVATMKIIIDAEDIDYLAEMIKLHFDPDTPVDAIEFMATNKKARVLLCLFLVEQLGILSDDFSVFSIINLLNFHVQLSTGTKIKYRHTHPLRDMDENTAMDYYQDILSKLDDFNSSSELFVNLNKHIVSIERFDETSLIITLKQVAYAHNRLKLL
jgi:hypothetical protein